MVKFQTIKAKIKNVSTKPIIMLVSIDVCWFANGVRNMNIKSNGTSLISSRMLSIFSTNGLHFKI